MTRLHQNFVFLAVGALIAAYASAEPPMQESQTPRSGSGTYYLALDAAPFGLPPGLSLPGIMTLHADRTAIVVDGGDFGGLPFNTRDSAQLGSWRPTFTGMEVVLLFLQADAATADVLSWQRVHITLKHRGRETLIGKVNVFQLACAGPAPFPVFNCPDPIESAADFVPNSPPDVPVTLRRLTP